MDKEFLFQKFDVSKKGARSSEFLNAFSKIKDSIFANVNASIVRTVTCPVKALVDATPISGPTCI